MFTITVFENDMWSEVIVEETSVCMYLYVGKNLVSSKSEVQCIVLVVPLKCVRTIELHRVTYSSVMLHEMHK